jgi:hypothetical protein
VRRRDTASMWNSCAQSAVSWSFSRFSFSVRAASNLGRSETHVSFSPQCTPGGLGPAVADDAGTPRQKQTLGKIADCVEALQSPLPLQPLAVYGTPILTRLHSIVAPLLLPPALSPPTLPPAPTPLPPHCAFGLTHYDAPRRLRAQLPGLRSSASGPLARPTARWMCACSCSCARRRGIPRSVLMRGCLTWSGPCSRSATRGSGS